MTRASATTGNMSQFSQSRKNGGGGNYPQWMRTLEEKYQKLHKKITENTTIGYGRFNSCVGRTVYDARLSQALLRYKDLAVQKNNLKSKSTTKVGEINNNNEADLTATENEILSEQNQYLHNTFAIEPNNETVNNCEENEQSQSSPSKQIENLRLNINETLAHSDAISVDSENAPNSDAEDEIAPKNRTNENTGSVTVRGRDTSVISADKTPTGLKTDIDRLNVNKYCRKNLKTSVSRTSKVTSKSCPAKIQSKSVDRAGANQKRLLPFRSKSANRNAKMFTPMSEEAKHAISETIHEMNRPTPGNTQATEVGFIPSRGRKCVKTWVTPRKSKSSLEVRHVFESASQCLDNLHSDGVNLYERNSADDNDSCHSSGGTVPEDAHRLHSRLPEIQNGSARERNSVRNNSSYRLAGIGKYEIAHDTFEITPPGFDSRYNDMQVVEDRESETPPPDIRQRAIDKCSEWLGKYSK